MGGQVAYRISDKVKRVCRAFRNLAAKFFAALHRRRGEELQVVHPAQLQRNRTRHTVSTSRWPPNSASCSSSSLGDSLMGPNAVSRTAHLTLTSSEVCRSYLVGTCPHDLFTNTKQDFGPCPKAHPENLKIEYDGLSAPEKSKYAFEYDYMRDMQKYIDDCNRRIDSAQRRLEKTPDEIRQTNALLKTISDLKRTINTGLLEVSCLGEMGMVGLACTEFYKVRTAKMAREQAERDLKSLADTSGPSGHQKLQVCDVCGADLSRLDNEQTAGGSLLRQNAPRICTDAEDL